LDTDPHLIRVSRVHHPVTTLGHGRRIGLWMQGCTIGCQGCIARDTWDAAGGRTTEVAELIDRVVGLVRKGRLDGVTISGGEPFEQPAALLRLVAGISAETGELDWPVDLLCYSGMAETRLRRRYREVLGYLDALIPEPFVESHKDTARWRGSANQRIVCLSELGIQRYSEVDTEFQPARSMQLSIENGQIWLIGIPKRGDLDRISQIAATAGVELHGVTWRA
jgi:anaerobic ribonucleoside-triphosphate reductase activating protein